MLLIPLTKIATGDSFEGNSYFSFWLVLIIVHVPYETNDALGDTPNPYNQYIIICNTLTPQIKAIPSATYLIEHT